jgi:tetratricopeptide (TPR) repeat protein
MSAEPARIIALPQTEEPKPAPKAAPEPDPFAALAEVCGPAQHAQERQHRLLAELEQLKGACRWQEVIDLAHPVEKHHPELCGHGLDAEVRAVVAFALGQLGRFDEALTELEHCLAQDPANFRYHSSRGYLLLRSLQAAQAKEIVLTGMERKKRILEAHAHFQHAQKILPDRVTPYYREGRLYKDFDRDPQRAMPLFAQAVRNWEAYDDATRNERHQERKNAVKARYALASCLLDAGKAEAALEQVRHVLAEDQDYLKNEHKHFALGKILHALGRFQEALSALETASMFTPPAEVDYVFELMARCHLALGQAGKGLAAINRVPLKARRPYVRWTEADCLVALGKPTQARAVLLEAAERDRRGRHKAFIRLARMAYQHGQLADAASFAQQAVEFHRHTYGTPCADGLFWGAVAALRAGDGDTARRLEQELSTHRPGYPWLPKLRQALHDDPKPNGRP